MLATRGQIPVSGLLRLAGINFGAAAAEHLFSVMSGLEPMAMGEGQIAARVKAAQQDAAEAGTMGPVLTGLVEAALRASGGSAARPRSVPWAASVSPASIGQ
jgi:glutamyl-tRNA reductase